MSEDEMYVVKELPFRVGLIERQKERTVVKIVKGESEKEGLLSYDKGYYNGLAHALSIIQGEAFISISEVLKNGNSIQKY